MNMLYLATPITQYHSRRYDVVRNAVAARYPGLVLVEPAKAGWDWYEWQQAWALLLPILARLVIWPRRDGSIGRGVAFEYRCCRLKTIPVTVVTHNLALYDVFDMELTHSGSWKHYANLAVQGEEHGT